MSFDLAIFDPSHAPSDREAFIEWWERESRWDDEHHDYNDPQLTTAALRAWFIDMIAQFPAMNGPHSKPEMPEDESTLTDYTIGKSSIYAAFAWSKAADAGEAVLRLAERHKLGLFHVSSPNGEVFLPSRDGSLQVVHSG